MVRLAGLAIRGVALGVVVTSCAVLMTKGAKLPMLLMFSGVIGGLLAVGLIGIFIVPVVLALSYTLLGAWIAGAPAPPH